MGGLCKSEYTRHTTKSEMDKHSDTVFAPQYRDKNISKVMSITTPPLIENPIPVGNKNY